MRVWTGCREEREGARLEQLPGESGEGCTGSPDMWGLVLAQYRSADPCRGSWNPRDREEAWQNFLKC